MVQSTSSNCLAHIIQFANPPEGKERRIVLEYACLSYCQGGTVDAKPSIKYPSHKDTIQAGVVKLGSQVLDKPSQ